MIGAEYKKSKDAASLVLRLSETKGERHWETTWKGREMQGKHVAWCVLNGCQTDRRDNTDHKGRRKRNRRAFPLSQSSNMVRSWPPSVANPLPTTVTIQSASRSCGIREATGLSWALLHGTLSWTALGNNSSIPATAAATDLSYTPQTRVGVHLCALDPNGSGKTSL